MQKKSLNVKTIRMCELKVATKKGLWYITVDVLFNKGRREEKRGEIRRMGGGNGELSSNWGRSRSRTGF